MIRASSRCVDDASESFAAAVREGPDYVCTCCHRLMYRKTVAEFNPTKYKKLSEDFMNKVFPPEFKYTSAQQKVWICKTCDNTLKRGKMPAQAKANSLVLEDVPLELSDLNPMEVRLLSLRIPFMKMVALPVASSEQFMDQLLMYPPICNLYVHFCQGYLLKPR